MFSYSDYLLTSGREDKLIEDDCFSEDYVEDEDNEFDRQEFLDNHLGIEATTSNGKRLSKQTRKFTSLRKGSIGGMLESEISGVQKDHSYQNKLQFSVGKEI